MPILLTILKPVDDIEISTSHFFKMVNNQSDIVQVIFKQVLLKLKVCRKQNSNYKNGLKLSFF